MSNKAPSISTPSGGGAQSGLGEKFSPDLFTGTGNFSVPIALPPGRNGFQPELTLQYSTGNGNSPFGLGWGLSVPGVTRRTAKGIPVYDDKEDVFILSGAEDLIPMPSSSTNGPTGSSNVTSYRPRTEGLFAKIDRHLDAGNDYWLVRSKDGLKSWYGTPGTRGTDPAVVADPTDARRVFNWKLTRTQDPFGNVIEYLYERDQVREDRHHRWDQIYLSQIRYVDYMSSGPSAGQQGLRFLVKVVFNYGQRPDPFSEHKSGFEIRTVKRCSHVEVFTQADPIEPLLTRTYNLRYSDQVDSPEDQPLNGASLLRSVEVVGHDGAVSESLPPLHFRYSRYSPGKQRFKPIEGPLPPGSLATPQYELADLFGNGLPDIIEMAGGVVQYWRNKGNGSFDMPRAMREAPGGLNLGDADVQLIDADGDGRVDLMVNSPKISGYFPSRFGASWDSRSFRKYAQAPSFSLQDPEVKLVDLDGDGVTDAIRSGTSFDCFFNHPIEGWKGHRKVLRSQLEDFPGVSFADPRVKWADMSGDGLQDIVLVNSGSISYWPNQGYGRFGRRVQMRNCPRLPEGVDPRMVLIGDVDGDGVADVVLVGNRSVTVWVNRSGNSFSEPIVISNTPSVSQPDSARLEDLSGIGTAGVLFSIQDSVLDRHRMFFLDLTGGVKPYLLHEMDNNMGALTRVHYESSIRHYLRDQKRQHTRWKTCLPFPVQVVSQVEVIDRISKGKLTTSYLYHHGHWDGGEREFRGFGRVDQRDTETFERYNSSSPPSQGGAGGGQGSHPSGGQGLDFNEVQFEHYSPPTETRNWFHLGPVGDEFGEWQEVYFEDEYWQGDPSVLGRPQELADLLRALPRRAKRDAFRAMRGSQLRTELYALDERDPLTGNYVPGQGGRPYTVTESQFGVRLEYAPDLTAVNSSSRQSQSGYIFFTFSLSSRTTQWERGHDPMTQLSFTADYDEYGQPHLQMAIAVPRGRNYLLQADIDPDGGSADNGFGGWQGDPYLATATRTDYCLPSESVTLSGVEGFMADRVCRTISYEVLNNGTQSAFALRDSVVNATLPVATDDARFNIIGCSVNFYDGAAFQGFPLGELGDHGALVRSETLILTQSIVNAAYGSTPLPLQEGPTWSGEYPAAFQDMVPDELGYAFHDEPGYTEGWYSIMQRMEYDFHVDPASAKGLMSRSKDPMGNETEVTYDTFQLLPLTVTQKQDPASGVDLTTTAHYDYRVLQADLITEPNGNRSQFAFSPLGLLQRTAVMGKEGGTDEGDDIDTAPGTRLEYDFLAYYNAQQPVWVKTIKREYHVHDGDIPDGADPDATIATVEYTDGFGRLLQTRTQAEDVLFGNSLFGDSGLPVDQEENGDAVGVQRPATALPNVVVSGWQVYNNKGKVVEQYEPYFDRGFQYIAPFDNATLQGATQSGVSVRMYYDPRGQVVRTVNPDATEQWVVFGRPEAPAAVSLNALKTPVPFAEGQNAPPASGGGGFTPWESFTYDANDLAPITHPSGSGAPASHHYTPKSSLLDPLGRTIVTIDRLTQDPMPVSMNPDGTQPPWGTGEGGVVMQYRFDIRGNLLKVTDALDRTAFTHVYDLKPKSGEGKDEKGANILRTTHIDSGTKTALFDAAYRPTELRDAKGALILHGYDGLNRPTRIWARDNASEDVTLRQKLIYGDDTTDGPATPEATNHLGKLFEHYDEAGKVTLEEYDFKGNLLAKTRKVISDAELLSVFGGGTIDCYRVDWGTSTDSILGSESFRTDTAFDALNRPKRIVYPEDADAERKVATPTYNRAGALESVDFDGTDFVRHIAYNAKGQRLLIAFGNDVMTRYAYDSETFRLTRQRSETYSRTGWTFSTAGSVKQDTGYQYDLSGNIITTTERTTHCGVGGSNALDRNFQYDALYRLLQATGRENAPTITPIWDDSYRSNDHSTTTAYTQNYSYDRMGNILRLQHIGSSSFTKIFNPTGSGAAPDEYGASNLLNEIKIGGTTYDFTYDANGNLIQENASRFMQWDHADKMRCFFIDDGSTITKYAHYLYDAGGNRVKKLVRNDGGSYTSTTYIDGIFEHLTDGTETQNTLHVMDDKSRIAMLRVGAELGDTTPVVKYVLENHLGDSVLELASDGSKIEKEEYYPFGETSFASYGKKRYKYNGKERDGESGLYCYGARYYSVWTCRFISCDPLKGKYPQLSPYNYAGNKPITHKDIEGLQGTGDKPVKPQGNTISGTIYIQSDIDINGNAVLSQQQLTEFGNYAVSNIGTVYAGQNGNGRGPIQTNVQFQILSAGQNVNLGSNQVLWTVGLSGDSKVSGNTGTMNFNRRGNTAAHEFGHHMGLSDRYNYWQSTEGGRVAGTYETVDMYLPQAYDPQYFGNEGANLMNRGSQITDMQWDIIFSSGSEGLTQTTFFSHYGNGLSWNQNTGGATLGLDANDRVVSRTAGSGDLGRFNNRHFNANSIKGSPEGKQLWDYNPSRRGFINRANMLAPYNR